MSRDIQQILVFGDSLSWGLVPDTRKRLGFAKRWPGVLEGALKRSGSKAGVIENCLNGRTTASEDPEKPGRNGADTLAQVIEMNSPLNLVLILLGTNDFQTIQNVSAEASALKIRKLVELVRAAPIEPGMPVPAILLIAPPPITAPKSTMIEKFIGAVDRSSGFAQKLEKIADEKGCSFFDAGSVTPASKVDGIHLDEDQHLILGEALATRCLDLLKVEGE